MKKREYVKVFRSGSGADGPWKIARIVNGKLTVTRLIIDMQADRADSVTMVNIMARRGWKLVTATLGEYWFEGKLSRGAKDA